jgi:3-oxoacyl-ACP reductase-like protein
VKNKLKMENGANIFYPIRSHKMNSTIKIISRTSRAYKNVLKRQCSRTYATKSIFKEDSFKDQVVVVTGGSKGIGRAISDNFANLGANVVGKKSPGSIFKNSNFNFNIL